MSDTCLQPAGVVIKTANAPANSYRAAAQCRESSENSQYGPDALHVPVMLGRALHALQHAA